MTAPAVAPPTALSIAGSDSGGGAGIQADLRTFFACGVHGMTAVTAVTVQNSVGVEDFTEIPPAVIAAQIKAVTTDIGAHAAKTGMLATAAVIESVAATCDEVHIGQSGRTPLVVDPVAASMHGDPLLRADALDAIRDVLLPRASLVTPNLDEVRLLTDIEVTDNATARDAARALHALGPAAVLVKGGHLHRDPQCVDLLYDGTEFTELTSRRHPTDNTHGGGDTMAAAITAALAHGRPLPDAVAYGKRFVTRAVAESYQLGKGTGPVSPFWRLAPTDDLPA